MADGSLYLNADALESARYSRHLNLHHFTIPGLIFDFAVVCDTIGTPTSFYFPTEYKSDIHWGTGNCNAKIVYHSRLLTTNDRLFAVGNIVDGWHMMRKDNWNYPEAHLQGNAQILRAAAAGTDTLYLPGNHDIEIYRFLSRLSQPGASIFGVKVTEQAIFQNGAGLNLLTLHGHQYDDALFGENADFWYGVGLSAYMKATEIDSFLRERGLDYISVTGTGKKLVKWAINEQLGVRDVIIKAVDANDAIDEIVWGHTHEPEIGRTPKGKYLFNPGHSTETGSSSIVLDGRARPGIICWHKDRFDFEDEQGNKKTLSLREFGFDNLQWPPRAIEDEHTDNARRLERVMFRLWPSQQRNEAARLVRDAENDARLRGESPKIADIASPASRTPRFFTRVIPHRRKVWEGTEAARIEEIRHHAKMILSHTTAYLPPALARRKTPELIHAFA